jgi:hypothetical protein
MTNGTRIRTALAIAVAFYAAIIKTDLTEFNNPTVTLIYQILMKIAIFAVIFLTTYYNNDYTPEACQGTGLTRMLKAMKDAEYVGEDMNVEFTDEEVSEEVEEDE